LQISADAVVLVALVDGILKNVGTVHQAGPAIGKVGVKTVAGRITVGPDVSGIGTIVVREVLDVKDTE
jgi:hypothetical protein